MKLVSADFEPWKHLPEPNMRAIRSAFESLAEEVQRHINKTTKTAPILVNATDHSKGEVEYEKRVQERKDKEVLRQLTHNLNRIWKAVDKHEDNVPRELPLYGEELEECILNAAEKMKSENSNFAKVYGGHEDSDYKHGTKQYYKAQLKFLTAGVLAVSSAGIAYGLYKAGLRDPMFRECPPCPPCPPVQCAIPNATTVDLSTVAESAANELRGVTGAASLFP
ncbi:hypothetical protein PG984_014933 [Apiospora sp. TS-2023a]